MFFTVLNVLYRLIGAVLVVALAWNTIQSDDTRTKAASAITIIPLALRVLNIK